MLMMSLLTFMSMLPVWTAGKLDANVQAALGVASQGTLFLTVVCIGLSAGATAAVSQSLGAQRVRRAGFYCTSTVSLSLLLGTLVGSIGYCSAPMLLRILQVPPDIVPAAEKIWKIFMLGLPFQYVFNSTGVLFRATRQVITPLVTCTGVTLLYVFLCTGTGLGLWGLPNYGYPGIAWSIVASNIFGACINSVLLVHSGFLGKRTLPSLRWIKRGLPYLLQVAVQSGLSSLVLQAGYLVLFVLVASIPHNNVAALAGLTSGLRIEAFIFMPSMAFNMSAAILVGNCLGSGDERAARRVALTLLCSAILLMSLLALCFWPFRNALASLLSSAPMTQHYIVSYLNYNLASTPFTIATMVFSGIMVGAGAARYNLLIFGGSFWLLRLPLGWFLGHQIWEDASGVFCAMLLSQAFQTVLMLLVFHRIDLSRFAMRTSPPLPVSRASIKEKGSSQN